MKAPAFSGVFDNLAPEVISDISSNVENELTKSSSGSVSIHAHVNAIKGIAQEMIKKHILITGWGIGIRRALAERIAAKGWHVTIVGRRSQL